MTTIHMATLETRNFTFEAFGDTRAAARDALYAALDRHGKQYRLAVNWWHGEHEDPIETRTIELGKAYRDREAL